MCMFHYSHLQLGTYIIPFELYQYQIIPGAQKSSKKKVQKSEYNLWAKKASGSYYWRGGSKSRRDGHRLQAACSVPTYNVCPDASLLCTPILIIWAITSKNQSSSGKLSFHHQ